ncbi:MAG TPA: hypothetical protein VGM94_14370 [Galbitalea sp.]|jgi:hypothetical protein
MVAAGRGGDDHLDLRRIAADRAAIETAAGVHPRVGLSGVLGDRGVRAHRVRPMAPGVQDAWRWNLRDEQSRTWWPQGIALGDHDGVPLALVSWYAQPRRGLSMGARVSVVDLRDTEHPRYHHVLLVSPRVRDGRVAFDPVAVHAGGLAWTGDRLFVAATFAGFLEFRTTDILGVAGRAPRSGAPFGYRHVLPVHATHQPVQLRAADRMRYSFLSLETGIEGVERDTVRLVAGEYGSDDRLRLARIAIAADGGLVEDAHSPGVAHMQGAALHDGTWIVSASRGDRENGDLWVGSTGSLVRHAGVLPPGPEDVAIRPGTAEPWSVSEYPGRRWLYSITQYR